MAANPVAEDLEDWQADHLTDDTNEPSATGADPCGIGDAQDLSGNLRLLKSVVRTVAANCSWERVKGLKNAAGTGNIAFTYVSPTQFSVNDNFTGEGGGTRPIAQTGRRIMAICAGAIYYGTITAQSWSSPNTTVTVDWDGTAFDATVSDIRFGTNVYAAPFSSPLGITLGLNITNPGFTWQTHGLTSVLLKDPGAPPSVGGELGIYQNLLRFHSGTGIEQVYYGRILTKSGDQNIGAGAGFVTIADLSISIPATQRWHLKYWIIMNTVSTTGAYFKMIGPAGASALVSAIAGHGGSDPSLFQLVNTALTSLGNGFGLCGGATALSAVTIEANVATGAAAGNFDLQASELTQIMGSVNIYNSSLLIATRIQ